MQTAKIFQNGRSQAVRLPKEFRFKGTEVFIYREGEKIILSEKPLISQIRKGIILGKKIPYKYQNKKKNIVPLVRRWTGRSE